MLNHIVPSKIEYATLVKEKSRFFSIMKIDRVLSSALLLRVAPGNGWLGAKKMTN